MTDFVRVLEPERRIVAVMHTVDKPRQTKPWMRFVAAVGFGLFLGYVSGALAAVPPRAVSEPPAEVRELARSDGPALVSPSPARVLESFFAPQPSTTASDTHPALRDMVPGFAGSVTWITEEGNVFKWYSTAPAASDRAVPDGATSVAWADRATRLAYIHGRNGVLYVGSSRQKPVAIGASSAVWQLDDFNRLGWLSRPDADGIQTMHITSLENDGTAAVFDLDRLGKGMAASRILSFSEDGVAVTRSGSPDLGEAEELVLYGPDGSQRDHLEGVVVDSVRPDGSVVLYTDDPTERLIVPLDDASRIDFGGIPDDAVSGLRWAPDGGSYVVLTSYGLAYWGSGATAVRVISGELEDITWSADGRFLIGLDRIGRLVFYDFDTAETALVALGEIVERLEAH